VPDGSRFCPSCGSAVGNAAVAETETSAPTVPLLPPVDSLDRDRFIPGTVLAGRYRIVGWLGRCGMGEVFRADDLKLGQPVALKFLPAAVECDRVRLERFLNEVKIARQVSHPNVCRVYDVGEVDGHHFLSMEHVDGEDLASLLRQIGRLPQDKAVQIARQLCAGLAAAHEQGILHRDLKPANVMIDGRGRARITDFGLAGLAEGFEGEELRAGTPAYMAPEQLAGKHVSIGSDLYALGLLLFELFTGKRAFEATTPAEMLRLQQESTPGSPSSYVDGLDPAVERVILRCLERDPDDRPPSALAVAAALPGGDPLAAALAAGETPSPEMVAAAGPRGGLTTAVATTLLAIAIVGLLAEAGLRGKFHLTSFLPRIESTEVMQHRARVLVAGLGYPGTRADSVSFFEVNGTEGIQLLRTHGIRPTVELLGRPDQLVFGFFYRESQRPMVPKSLSGRITLNDPPPEPGDVALRLDLGGRLSYLRVLPPEVHAQPGPPATPDWAGVFEAAGLRLERFDETTPVIVPPTYADTRVAWTGTLSDESDRELRVEAAALDGKPVYFEKVVSSHPHWATAQLGEPVESANADPGVLAWLGMAWIALVAVVCGGSVWLALRSLALGRGDRRGAMRAAVLAFALRMLHWLAAGHHVPHAAELELLLRVLIQAMALGVAAWLSYIALEPYVRRIWPEAIVSWSRLMAGRFRDPLVGRDLLVGLAVGAVAVVIGSLLNWAGLVRGTMAPGMGIGDMPAIRGGRWAVGELVFQISFSLIGTAFLMMLFLILRIVLRRNWLAATAFVLLHCAQLAILVALSSRGSVENAILLAIFGGAITGIMLAVLLIRFGMLAWIPAFLANGFTMTIDPGDPHFAESLLSLLLLGALAVYAFRISLAGRPLFRGEAIPQQ
jgi:serine/threonine-protein kinase